MSASQKMRRKRGRTICPATGKLRYGTKDAAQQEAITAMLSSDRKRREVRAYFCDLCGCWHLTSLAVPPRRKRPSP